MKKLLVAGIVAVVGAFVWSTAPASAHHPEVTITACPGPEELQNFVDVTAHAFEIPADWTVDHRINTNVRLDVIGEGVNFTTTGQFVAPDYSFTARVEVPDAVGKTITARVTALAGWGASGDFPSTWDTEEATITIPLCADSGTTTTSTTIAPTSTQAPSTTEAPTSTQAPSSTVPTEVEGITQVRPQIPGGGGAADDAAAPGAQQLAFSGGETGPMVLGGAGVLAVGAALLVATRRRSA